MFFKVQHKNHTYIILFFGLLYILFTNILSVTLIASGEIGFKAGYRTSEIEDQKSTRQNFSSSIGFNYGLLQFYISYEIEKDKSEYELSQQSIEAIEITEYIIGGTKLFLPITNKILPYLACGLGRRIVEKKIYIEDVPTSVKYSGPTVNLGAGLHVAFTRYFGLEFSYTVIPIPSNNDWKSSYNDTSNFSYDHIMSAGITIKIP